MKWFGPSWGAPACRPEDHTATPVGAACQWCQEPVTAQEQGFLDLSGMVFHLPCFLRITTGSLGCLAGLCFARCRPRCVMVTWEQAFVTMEDPPGLTRREAALAAMEFREAPEDTAIRTAIFTRWVTLGQSRL